MKRRTGSRRVETGLARAVVLAGRPALVLAAVATVAAAFASGCVPPTSQAAVKVYQPVKKPAFGPSGAGR